MPNPSWVIVIIEDEHHEMVVRRYLRKRGIEPRQVRFERSPSGSGNAEGWVRKKFAKEVGVCRNRQARAASGLVAMIDADNHTVDERFRQLDQSLHEEGQPLVRNDEQIVRLVPRRNIETWILSLTGTQVDETSDYKQERNDWKELIPNASEALFHLTQQDVLPGTCIDSLRRGVRELHRLHY